MVAEDTIEEEFLTPRHEPLLQAALLDDERSAEEPKLPLDELSLMFGRYAFAHNCAFWRGAIWSAVFGSVLGLVALGYMQLISYIPQLWQGEHYAQDASQVCFACGKLWWVAVSGGGGLLVGLIRVRFLPHKPPGMFIEVLRHHVDPLEAPWIGLLSIISLSVGGSVGPEAGLCTLGGAVGTAWAWVRQGKYTRLPPMTQREQEMNTVTGMCAMLGSLLPSPFLAVTLMSELGGSRVFQHYLESTAHAAIAATTSFMVYHAVVEETTLKVFRLPFAVNDIDTHIEPFKVEYYLYATLLGLLSACVAMLILVLFAISGRLFQRVTQRSQYAIIGLCTFTGLFVGISGYLLPLTFGDGTLQLPSLIRPLSNCTADVNCYREPAICDRTMSPAYFCNNLISTKLLIGTVALKMFTFALSSNLGFVGGIILPNVFIGAGVGVLAHRVVPESLPIWLSVSCMAAAVPGSFTPAPVTMTLLPTLMFVFNGQQTAPVFLAVVTGYCFMHLVLLGTVVKKAGGTGSPHQAFSDHTATKPNSEEQGKLEGGT